MVVVDLVVVDLVVVDLVVVDLLSVEVFIENNHLNIKKIGDQINVVADLLCSDQCN